MGAHFFICEHKCVCVCVRVAYYAQLYPFAIDSRLWFLDGAEDFHKKVFVFIYFDLPLVLLE